MRFEIGEGFDPDVGTPSAATMVRLVEPRKQRIQSYMCKKLDLANNLDKPPWSSSSGQTGFPGGLDSKKNLPSVQETQVPSLDREDPLEKEMAPHSSILVWRILWTEEPGGLQSMGSQRVRHD